MGVRWVEISPDPERARFQALSRALAQAGLDNQVEFIEADAQNFNQELSGAFRGFDQIRVGGELRTLAPSVLESLPAEVLSLQIADAFVRDPAVAGKWWPRCYLAEGIRREIVSGAQIAAGDLAGKKDFDFTGAIFLLGETSEARAAVGAFSRLGFRKFSIACLDDDRGRIFVEELARRHFGIEFEFVPRIQITQLPAVHVFAINTLKVGEDDGMHGELVYFNFLKAGGCWLDLSFHAPNADLEAEARSVGAVIESGARIAAWTDAAWAEEAFAIKLDAGVLGASYLAAFQTRKT